MHPQIFMLDAHRGYMHKINTEILWTNYQEHYMHVRILLVKDLYCYGEKGLEWVIIKAQRHSTLTYPGGQGCNA